MPDKIYGIMKCYNTKTGAGPMVEFPKEESDRLREFAKEYGNTTGRPRKIGYCDLVAINYAIERSNVSDLIITKLDILNGMEKIPVIVKYDKIPVCGNDLFNPKTTMAYVQGWNDPRDFGQIKDFVGIVQNLTDRKVSHISCGVNKEDLIKIKL
jgi:adenylosuccinate synthase